MGKKLIIVGADFSENGFRTSNLIDVELKDGGTNPYKLYLLPTALTYEPNVNTYPAVPEDAVLKTISNDGVTNIDSAIFTSFLCGRNTTSNSTINIQSLTINYNKNTVSDANQSFMNINADVVDLRGIKFGAEINAKKMFTSSSIGELKIPDIVVNEADNMFYNYCNERTDANASFTFIKKLKGSCEFIFRFLKCATADFSGIDVKEVTEFKGAFRDSTLSEIDLSDWDIKSTANVHYMFYQCRNLVTLHLDNWDNTRTPGINHTNDIFTNTPLLTTVYVTNCSSEAKTWLLARLNECTAGNSSNWVESTVGGKAALVKGS